nr:MAG TPA: hypothetical protein [Caudoviricetes sp.]
MRPGRFADFSGLSLSIISINTLVRLSHFYLFLTLQIYNNFIL